MDNQRVLWLDGKLVPANQPHISVLNHSLHYGVAVFEGVRAYHTEAGPAIFRLQEHTKRLRDSAKALNMKLPFDQEAIVQAQCDVVVENKLSSAYIRPLCYLGTGIGLRAINLPVHVMVAAEEWGRYLGDDVLEQGIRVKVSSYTRMHINSQLTKAKVTGNYVNSVLALNEAMYCGFDEALLLDHQGYVAEGSGENFFMVIDGKLHTPPTASILAGITRDTVITLAKDLGITVIERNITRDEVYVADEAFFTGTAAEVTPISELDTRIIGSGKRGPMTEKLQSLYFDIVKGRNSKYQDWLTVASRVC